MDHWNIVNLVYTCGIHMWYTKIVVLEFLTDPNKLDTVGSVIGSAKGYCEDCSLCINVYHSVPPERKDSGV